MPDRKGDPAKKPEDCKGERPGDCPHIKCTYEGWDGERYRCELCGASYFLDYEEMR